jgi:hypothetical protein
MRFDMDMVGAAAWVGTTGVTTVTFIAPVTAATTVPDTDIAPDTAGDIAPDAPVTAGVIAPDAPVTAGVIDLDTAAAIAPGMAEAIVPAAEGGATGNELSSRATAAV